ncbi:MAG: hypothetical protein Q9168_000170 [Polycauliona sp. 1 TL-2023]
MNIYSHLLGAAFFSIAPAYLYQKLKPDYLRATQGDVIVFSTFFYGVAVCFLLSSTYHIISNHSPKVQKFGNQLDYIGIVILMWGSTVPSIYYGLACDPRLQKAYWLNVTFLAAICIIATLHPSFRHPTLRPYRAAMYAGLGLSAVVFVLHGLALHGWSLQNQRMSLDWMALMAGFNLLGATIYAARIPEKLRPYKYDIFGSSHQILHVAVILAGLAHMFGKNAELLQGLNETQYASSALKQSQAYLNDLNREIKSCNTEVQRLGIKTASEYKEHKKYPESTASRFMHRAPGKKERFAEKAKWVKNRDEAAKHHATLEGTDKTHKRLQAELDALYDFIIEGPMPGFQGEDVIEFAMREAKDAFNITKQRHEAELRAIKCLQGAQWFMLQVLQSLDDARSHSPKPRTLQTRSSKMLVQQAQRLSPGIQGLRDFNISHGHVMSDIVFDNIFSDVAQHDRIKDSQAQAQREPQTLSNAVLRAQERSGQLLEEANAALTRLETSRRELQQIRQDTLASLAVPDQASQQHSPGELGDEFSGLELQLGTPIQAGNVFTTESIAIAAIHAMKETALEDYDASLTRFDFIDILPPENPVRIFMVAAPFPFAAALKRSSVLWTIKSLAVDVMKIGILRPLSFQVRYGTHNLYFGSLGSAGQAFGMLDRSSSHPLSLSTPSVHDSTGVALRQGATMQDQPHYQINFDFTGEALSQIGIFESILTLLLQLAKEDSATVFVRTSMERRQIPAKIFIQQIAPPPPAYRFQQYHAVALLEAVARYYVFHNRYTEMTFDLITNGYLVAWGCVTRAVVSRRWCNHMFPDGRAEANGLVTRL